MTDIVLPSAVAVPDLVGFGSPSESMARLAQWVDAASNANRLVRPLVASAFVPEAYKPKVDPRATDEQKREAYEVAVANATAAVLQGLSIGLDPLVSLQQIYIVYGRPGMYTKIKVALLQARGHEVWTEELADDRVVVAGRRKGSENPERVTITMEQAKRAGWTTNAAYAKTPQDMLWARAASRVCDRIAPDVLMGIASVEEISDEPPLQATATVARRITAAEITGRDEPELQSAAEPAEPISVPPVTDSDPAPEPITQAQQRKLHALLRDAGLGDRDAGLAAIAAILGRDVESTKELSKQDAKRVIDELEKPTEPDEPPLDGDWLEPTPIPDGA